MIDPHRYWLDQGYALGQANRLQEAKSAFLAALQYNPRSPHAYAGLALTHEKLGEEDHALWAYDCATSLAPEMVDLWVAKGQILQRKQRSPEALAAFEWALRFRPNDPHLLMKRGVVLGTLRRYPEAIQAFEQFVGRDAENPMAWYNLAVAEARAQRFPQAYGHLQAAKARATARRPAQVDTAAWKQQQDEIDSMLTLLRTVVEEPNDADGWVARGGALSHYAGLDAAIAALREGLTRYPGDVQLTTMLSSFQRWKGDAAGASSTLDALPARVQQDPRALLAAAKTLAEAGGNEDALRLLEQACAAAPHHSKPFFNRAAILRSLGRDREAISLLETFAASHPQSKLPWLALGAIYLSKNMTADFGRVEARWQVLPDGSEDPRSEPI